MSELPLVSVIAVCYNHANYVVETLDSIKNQTYPNIELIIMDDCSIDNSVEVIQEWMDKNKYQCQFIAHKENQGLCKTLNEALKKCTGKYFQTLACDDIVLKEKIKKQVYLFNELNDDYAVVYSDALLMDDSSQILYGHFIQRHKPKMLKVPTGNVYNELILSNYIPAMSVLIRINLVKKIGGFDEQLSYEDYDLWLRLSKEYKFYFSDYPSCQYRIHGSNLHSSGSFKEKSAINSFKIYCKHLENDIAKNKLKNVIHNLYKNNQYYNYKEKILSLNITPELNYFLKRDISYKNYKRFLSFKKNLRKFA